MKHNVVKIAATKVLALHRVNTHATFAISSMECTPSSAPVRTTKRKLEDAIRTLDDAFISPSLGNTIDRPMQSKRPHITPSVYSTLKEFSGVSKEWPQPSSNVSVINVSKSAPHLAAILARSALQSKEVPPFSSFLPPVHPASEYRPSSTDSFLFRLATFKITTYANKPSQIDAVAAARCGWINDGKDRLVCGLCGVSWVLAGREGMTKDAAGALIEKQRVSLVEMHKGGCPWKERQCEPSVYRVPLQAPAAMARELGATALSLEPALANVAIKHPLTSSQISSLRSIFSVVTLERLALEHDSIADVDRVTHAVVFSDAAIVVALCGWVPAPSVPLHRTSPSFSHRGSSGPSVSVPSTPSLSRTSSVSCHFQGRAGTPTPSASARMSISQFTTPPDRIKLPFHANMTSTNFTTIPTSQVTPLVYCVLCHRRVGLWGYTQSEAATPSVEDGHSASSREHPKKFDPVKEHRSYCPYVVRSSAIPSFPDSFRVGSLGNAIEGWRAVLTVVQRFELGQRQRLSRFLNGNDPDGQEEPSAELKGVEAMVSGVKINGGQELLRYVKSLLG